MEDFLSFKDSLLILILIINKIFKEIGGYHTLCKNYLEDFNDIELHSSSLKLFALGRHCLVSLIKYYNPKYVYLPYYTCESVKITVLNLNCKIIFYNLDNQFQPKIEEVRKCSLLVINNYLGLTLSNKDILSLSNKFKNTQIVVDNTQSLCLKNQFRGYFSFCSPRKFLPLTDGGILFDDYEILDTQSMPLLQDKSCERVSWLFRNLDDLDKNTSYPEYIEFRNSIQNIEYSKISNTTKFLISKFNIKNIIYNRNLNFIKLQDKLPIHPSFHSFCNLNQLTSPIGFPLHVKDARMTQSILKGFKVYTIIYWPNLDINLLNSFEKDFLNTLLILPIDKIMTNLQIQKLNEILNQS